MDYGQFLMECVEEYVNDSMAFRSKYDLGYDDLCDYWCELHDEWIENIYCYFYMNGVHAIMNTIEDNWAD